MLQSLVSSSSRDRWLAVAAGLLCCGMSLGLMVEALADEPVSSNRELAAADVTATQLNASKPGVQRLIVAPTALVLHGSRDRQLIVVQAEAADGSTRDVTAESVISFTPKSPSDGPVVAVSEGVVTPVANGTTSLNVEYAGQRVTVPVQVSAATEEPVVSFRNDVLAVLTKAGCNTGKCHGSASGKDGFRLSLFGYDPAGDQYRLTRELSGRRVNLGAPEQSLLLQKGLGEVPHTGGQRLYEETEHYRIVLAWIAAGAAPDAAGSPEPLNVTVYPKQVVFDRKGSTQRLIVRAKFSDGSERDITDKAVFISNNDAAATVDDAGIVTGTGTGAAFILARFDKFTEGASIIVRPGTPFPGIDFPANNYIDELVAARFRELHLIPSELCSDETFLRRATLDLTGLLPSVEERRAFLASTATNKREQLVDTLLARPEFNDIWVMKIAEMLQIRTANGVSPKGLQRYDSWLRDKITSGATLDKVVRELIPATGGTFENPATHYYQTETTPQLLAENLAQAFLGTRIQCAQCHNHPFDRWTMDDYYGFAAFFSQVGYKQAQDPRELTVFNAASGEMMHPLKQAAVAPQYLGGEAPNIPAGQDYRQSLADWLASSSNAAFSQHLGNVVWAHFFGVGIVDAVDDIRISNPPSNRPLFEELGRRMGSYGFDIKKLARDICLSRTYQLDTRRNESNKFDERNYSHGKIRRLRAEVLLDCLTQVTESKDRFPGLPAGSRAVQVADGRTPNYFLNTFGRAPRTTPCTCEVQISPTLSQALHLINGETTTGKIQEGKILPKMLAELGGDPNAVAAVLFERCISRLPTAEEATAIRERFAAANDVNAALEDFFWALLNSQEFIFNH